MRTTRTQGRRAGRFRSPRLESSRGPRTEAPVFCYRASLRIVRPSEFRLGRKLFDTAKQRTRPAANGHLTQHAPPPPRDVGGSRCRLAVASGEVAGGRSKAARPAAPLPPSPLPTVRARDGIRQVAARGRQPGSTPIPSLPPPRAPHPFNRAPFASRPMVGLQRAGGRQRRRRQHPKQRRAAAAEGPWRRRRRSSTRPPGWWPPSASSSSPSPSPPSASSTTSARYALR